MQDCSNSIANAYCSLALSLRYSPIEHPDRVLWHCVTLNEIFSPFCMIHYFHVNAHVSEVIHWFTLWMLLFMPLFLLCCSDRHLNAPYQAWTMVCVFCHGTTRSATCASNSLIYVIEVNLYEWEYIWGSKFYGSKGDGTLKTDYPIRHWKPGMYNWLLSHEPIWCLFIHAWYGSHGFLIKLQLKLGHDGVIKT